MTVTRYRTDPEFVYMIESSRGPYVLHEDCAVVERERDELRREVERLTVMHKEAVCEGATIGQMSATADAQERERRLREAVASLLNWAETIGKLTPYEMPRSERDAFRKLIGAVPTEDGR